VVDSFDLAPNLSLLTGKRRYGQLIASRFPLRPLAPDEFNIPWPERVLSAAVSTVTGELELHTTHIPPGSSNGWIKIYTLEGIHQRLAHPSDIPRILCGDFNSPQLETTDGRVVVWGERVLNKGKIKTRQHIRGASGQRWVDGERNVIEGLTKFDLTDIFRQLNGYHAQDFSWYVNHGRKSTGRRFDHIFASLQLRPTRCHYLHEFRNHALSDHSAIEAWFDLTGGLMQKGGIALADHQAQPTQKAEDYIIGKDSAGRPSPALKHTDQSTKTHWTLENVKRVVEMCYEHIAITRKVYVRVVLEGEVRMSAFNNQRERQIALRLALLGYFSCDNFQKDADERNFIISPCKPITNPLDL
jgi:exonuclease III